MSKITPEEVEDLCDRLANLELSDPQRALLNAILKIAWRATAAEEDLENGVPFNDSFEPNQAAMILAYHPSGQKQEGAAGAQVAMIPRLISGLIK